MDQLTSYEVTKRDTATHLPSLLSEATFQQPTTEIPNASSFPLNRTMLSNQNTTANVITPCYSQENILMGYSHLNSVHTPNKTHMNTATPQMDIHSANKINEKIDEMTQNCSTTVKNRAFSYSSGGIIKKSTNQIAKKKLREKTKQIYASHFRWKDCNKDAALSLSTTKVQQHSNRASNNLLLPNSEKTTSPQTENIIPSKYCFPILQNI